VHPFALAQFGHSQESLRRLMTGYGYETFLIFAADMPPVMVPASARIECAMIFNLLRSTPAAIAECWRFTSETWIRRPLEAPGKQFPAKPALSAAPQGGLSRRDTLARAAHSCV
jgi:hypothetical protein